MSEEDVREALRTIDDPEAGMSIVDLGLVYAIRVEERRIEVDMTMTSPACPSATFLVEEAAAAIRDRVPSNCDVDVQLVWDPPWTPERMSAEAQKKFGWT